MKNINKPKYLIEYLEGFTDGEFFYGTEYFKVSREEVETFIKVLENQDKALKYAYLNHIPIESVARVMALANGETNE